MERIFAVDFTHEGLTAAFVTPDGTAEDMAGFDLIDFLAGETNPLDKMVTLLIAKAKASGAPFEAVSLALPCDLSPKRDRVVNFPSAHWLNDRPLPEIISNALGVPVVMERRSVVSLCYDRIMLGLPDACVALGCYVDTHYDTAIWHNGGLLLGRNGIAGNISHMTIQEREDNCFCGKAGCVDLYGAGLRLGQMHRMIFPDLPKNELFERHGEHPIVLDYITMMAYPIAIEVNIIDPDFLILGGDIPFMPGFPRKYLEAEILRQLYRPPETTPATIMASLASSTPGVVCAAQYAMVKLGVFG